jgi:UDP-glucuronate decarboxylase
METLEVSYDGVKNLLAKVKKDKSKFIFFSSSEIYGNPDFKNLPTKETYYGYGIAESVTVAITVVNIIIRSLCIWMIKKVGYHELT